MTDQSKREAAHGTDVTVWVGKAGIDGMIDELDDQLAERELVKVKILRSARGGTSTDELAAEIAERVEAELIETRGHTAVFAR